MEDQRPPDLEAKVDALADHLRDLGEKLDKHSGEVRRRLTMILGKLNEAG